jgi:response regulator of citrate/malate metabolism
MNTDTPKILIVDDDPGVLFLHKIIVREGNLSKNPIIFSEADKALEFIIPIDLAITKILVFLDINMPKTNGWDFLNLLVEKVKNADIKVVMVTSSLSKEEREKSKEYCHVIDYWEKPMDETQVSVLKEKLRVWLGEQHTT